MKTFNLDTSPLALANRFKIQVIKPRPCRARDARRGRASRRGKVVFETDWQNNLILDSGMDRIASDYIVNLFTYCVIGTGNTPTEDLSGGITATTSGATCTASAPIFAVGDIGKLLRFVTGEKATITGYTNSTTVTLASSLGVTAQTFIMYRVNQTGLATERTGAGYRNNNYLTGSGNCGTTLASSVLTHRRTWDFPIEVSNQNYAEVGFSHSATVAANINMRALLSGGSVTVLTGQQIRVVYDFVVTLSPTSPRSKKFPITGWPSLQAAVTVDAGTDKITLTSHGFAADTEVVFGGTVAPGGLAFATPYYVVVDAANTFKVAATPGGAAIDITSNGTSVHLLTNTLGTEQLQMVGASCINTSGGIISYSGDAVGAKMNEPSENALCCIATDATAHPTWPGAGYGYTGAPTGSPKAMALDTYVNGTFNRTKSVTFSASEANSAAIRTIAVQGPAAVTLRSGVRFLFNHPQEKTSLNTLTVRFRFTWDRDFS